MSEAHVAQVFSELKQEDQAFSELLGSDNKLFYYFQGWSGMFWDIDAYQVTILKGETSFYLFQK